MVAIPLSFVVNKKRQSLNELESAMDNSALVVIENDRKNSELARREGMRTNAAQLQAELVEIQNIEEQYERVKRMARWKISVGIFNSTYQPMLEKEKRFDDGLSFIDEDYVAVRDR